MRLFLLDGLLKYYRGQVLLLVVSLLVIVLGLLIAIIEERLGLLFGTLLTTLLWLIEETESRNVASLLRILLNSDVEITLIQPNEGPGDSDTRG
jgi:hypothetical protein